MSNFSIGLIWQRSTPDFDVKTFSRDHVWRLAGGQTVQGSSAPAYSGNPEMSNPEEALLAALSSCHMLTFLSIAALRKLVVDRYEDEPVAELGKNEKGKIWVAQMTLRPRVTFGGGTIPDEETVRQLHRKAKENCFVGNSLLSQVMLEPRF
ncbi:MAG: OsmC family protein [Candidatus Contendobacter sp.]|nr:OsmC family protein [Candidatus Contendobacter sp.]MDG4559324.1 OsmC family protein [Candidatus Contendobacter sp.]